MAHEPSWLQTGLHALVRAGEQEAWFFGHIGAAYISGAALVGEFGPSPLPAPARARLAARLPSLSDPFPEWVRPLDEPVSRPADPGPVVEQLADRIATLRMSGHPTIYAVAALRAMHARPELTTERVVAGVLRLCEAARGDDRERYLGVDDSYVVDEHDREHASRGADAALDTALEACAQLTPDRDVEGRRYFLFGEKIHVLTHLHALRVLESLGHAELARRGLIAQASQVRLCRFPDEAQRSLPAPASVGPTDAAFWEVDGVDVLHKLKLAEAVLALGPAFDARAPGLAAPRFAQMWGLLGL